MLISRICIENFKGIGDRIEVELKPITLLFGPNSAGKSSILHALHYAVEALERHNLDADITVTGGDYVNLGGFHQIVHDHDLSRKISLRFETSGNEELFDSLDQGYSQGEAINEYLQLEQLGGMHASSFCSTDNAAIEICIAWQASTARPYVSDYRLFLAGELFAQVEWAPDTPNAVISILETRHRAMTTVRQWEASEGSTDGHYEDPDNSCLELCLRESLEFLPRIAGEPASDGSPTFTPMILKLKRGALPSPGEAFVIPVTPLADLYPKEENGRSFYDQKVAAHRLAEEVALELGGILTDPLNLIREYLQEFRYLGPIRMIPDRRFSPSKSLDRVSGADRRRWSSGLGAWEALCRAPETLVPNVNAWLADSEKLDAGYELLWKSFKELDTDNPLIIQLLNGRAFDDVESTEVAIHKLVTSSRLCILPKGSAIELEPADVGVGISQVVPVIVSAVDDVDAFTAIEQPELHLHPRLQARLADLFLESSNTSIHGFLLETHSEHLLLRIQRRIRECSRGERPLGVSVSPRNVAIYYIRQHEGQTKALRMNLDDTGEFIEPWPDDFFELDFNERFA